MHGLAQNEPKNIRFLAIRWHSLNRNQWHKPLRNRWHKTNQNSQCVTIVGIPFGIQSFKLGVLALWPFGQRIEYMDYAPGCLSTIMNILWLFIGGIWIMLTHVIFGLLLGITIIGIPWAKQHFKMASLALTPFGRRVV